MFTNQPDAISGELADLMSYLEANYRQETKQPEAVSMPVDPFITWAKQHLIQHRPSEVFAVDNNYGILLTNGQRVQLCPNVPSEPQRTGGDMANPDTSIPVTRMK